MQKRQLQRKGNNIIYHSARWGTVTLHGWLRCSLVQTIGTCIIQGVENCMLLSSLLSEKNFVVPYFQNASRTYNTISQFPFHHTWLGRKIPIYWSLKKDFMVNVIQILLNI